MNLLLDEQPLFVHAKAELGGARAEVSAELRGRDFAARGRACLGRPHDHRQPRAARRRREAGRSRAFVGRPRPAAREGHARRVRSTRSQLTAAWAHRQSRSRARRARRRSAPDGASDRGCRRVEAQRRAVGSRSATRRRARSDSARGAPRRDAALRYGARHLRRHRRHARCPRGPGRSGRVPNPSRGPHRAARHAARSARTRSPCASRASCVSRTWRSPGGSISARVARSSSSRRATCARRRSCAASLPSPSRALLRSRARRGEHGRIEGSVSVRDGTLSVAQQRFERVHGAARVRLDQPGEVDVERLSAQLAGAHPRPIELRGRAALGSPGAPVRRIPRRSSTGTTRSARSSSRTTRSRVSRA